MKRRAMLTVETDVWPLVKKAQAMEHLQACKMTKQLFTLGIEHLNNYAVKVMQSVLESWRSELSSLAF